MVTDGKDTQDVVALVDKGIELVKADRCEEALSYYYKALEIEPKNVHILNSIAGALCGLSKYDESIKYCDKTLEIEPENLMALNGKCGVLFNQSRYDESKELFEKVLEIDPENVQATINSLNWVVVMDPKNEEAKELRDRLIKKFDF